jgi:hypothetical protein
MLQFLLIFLIITNYSKPVIIIFAFPVFLHLSQIQRSHHILRRAISNTALNNLASGKSIATHIHSKNDILHKLTFTYFELQSPSLILLSPQPSWKVSSVQRFNSTHPFFWRIRQSISWSSNSPLLWDRKARHFKIQITLNYNCKIRLVRRRKHTPCYKKRKLMLRRKIK